MENQLSARTAVSAETAGFAGNPKYSAHQFFSYVNSDGTQHTNGVRLEYNQPMDFLPGGVRFRYRGFNAQLRSTWQSARLISSEHHRRQRRPLGQGAPPHRP